MGNLTKNPELRYTPANVAVCEFSIAINRDIPLQNGQQKTETTFVPIQVWGKNAEPVSRFLQKGSSVLIDGSLKYESWEKDGRQCNKILVIGNSLAKDLKVIFRSYPKKKLSIYWSNGYEKPKHFKYKIFKKER